MAAPTAPPYETAFEEGLGALGAAQHAQMEALVIDNKENLCFENGSIRQGFIKKVFALLTIMLLIVTIMASIPFILPSLKSSIQANIALFYSSVGIFLVVSLLLIFVERLRRTVPYNLIACAIVALSTGYAIMMVVSYMDIVAVLMAFGGTTTACFFVVIFAIQTRWELFSILGGFYFFFTMFLISGFLFSFAAFRNIPVVMCLYSWGGVIGFMIFFAIDIQLVMGGRRFAISEEEYVFAALTLFLDIVRESFFY